MKGRAYMQEFCRGEREGRVGVNLLYNGGAGCGLVWR